MLMLEVGPDAQYLSASFFLQNRETEAWVGSLVLPGCKGQS